MSWFPVVTSMWFWLYRVKQDWFEIRIFTVYI